MLSFMFSLCHILKEKAVSNTSHFFSIYRLNYVSNNYTKIVTVCDKHSLRHYADRGVNETHGPRSICGSQRKMGESPIGGDVIRKAMNGDNGINLVSIEGTMFGSREGL